VVFLLGVADSQPPLSLSESKKYNKFDLNSQVYLIISLRHILDVESCTHVQLQFVGNWSSR
jgi:hypothetical protein